MTGLDDAARREWEQQGVLVFETYARAAAHAVRLGLIRTDQALEVAEDVRRQAGSHGLVLRGVPLIRRRQLAQLHMEGMASQSALP